MGDFFSLSYLSNLNESFFLSCTEHYRSVFLSYPEDMPMPAEYINMAHKSSVYFGQIADA